MTAKSLTLHPIGIIRTPYKDKYHAPRQPGLDQKSVIGTIELFPDKNFDQALEYLEGFERIWIIYWFDKNTDWKPKVLPPRSGRTKRGVFATRSPHRPNPIGLSTCKLIDVKGRTIRVENPDMLDGTPILDIKPYIPYAEAFPDADAGWLDELEPGGEKQYSVSVLPLAMEQSRWLEENCNIRIMDRIVDILSFDPLPHSYRRIMKHGNGYVVAVKSWRAFFSIDQKSVTVTSIHSGYPPEVIRSLDPEVESLHNQQAHIAFHAQWMT